jgi:hypothetical protein
VTVIGVASRVAGKKGHSKGKNTSSTPGATLRLAASRLGHPDGCRCWFVREAKSA